MWLQNLKASQREKNLDFAGMGAGRDLSLLKVTS